ncbi:hypothetical protein EJ04DRAFT_541502 [Polyplosphaeria fusca]|uniref:Uncharacterized protein n=1 Tax=Polyplosphaeria fusca TaxID=682080 RepID=A0A9P4R2P7_9PLEO|nr:hypothetical protein EJ04DRAFT_541502 [Polyplosphaeria fusca]
MSHTAYTDPNHVLNFESASSECQVALPTNICFVATSSGGLVASIIAKHALNCVSRNPRTASQTDIRSSHVHFFRPIFPAKGPVTLKAYEVNLGKTWSTFRVEVLQGETAKIAASGDVLVTNLALPGKTLNTNWELSPPPPLVDLSSLDTDSDPAWTLHHLPLDCQGLYTAPAYIKNYMPLSLMEGSPYIEHWMSPGWDCSPLGSRDPRLPEARWTNGLLQWAVDMTVPILGNFLETEHVRQKNFNLARFRTVALKQRAARQAGRANWRQVDEPGGDSLDTLEESVIQTTLTMSTEIKRRLPDEGVRWLYVRSEAKSIQNGRLDVHVVLFDEKMRLVAISNQVAVVIPTVGKAAKKAVL